MIQRNYRIKPKNFQELILEFIKTCPNGITSRDIAKKFNTTPYKAGKELGLLHRNGMIRVTRPNGPKDSLKVFYPIFLSEETRKTISETILKRPFPSSSSSSLSESDSESEYLYPMLKNPFRNLSETLEG